MARDGRAERMALLRGAIAGIEARAGAVPAGAPARLVVARALDAALGGGLSGDALHEIAPARAGDAAAAMGFALALAARFVAAAPGAATALLIAEDSAAREAGVLYGPGLAAHGLEPGRLVLVRAPDARALLWAMEEALKSGAPAVVVGEMASLRPYGLAASRRLLLAARAGRAPALLVLGGGFGRTDVWSSAAETRFEIAAAASARRPSAGGRLALPGAAAFAARLVKARLRPGAPARGFDAARVIRLEWHGVEGDFRDPAVSLPVVRAAADGSGAGVAR
jgi:protein ImuA